MGFLELRRQCGVSHEVRQGAQGASHVAPGKSGLHVPVATWQLGDTGSWLSTRPPCAMRSG